MAFDAGSVMVGVELGGMQAFTSGWLAAAAVVLQATKKMVSYVADSVAKTASLGDEVQKMAQRIEVSSQSLSEYKHALEQSGTSLASFEIGLRGMLRAQRDAVDGTARQIKSFKEIGISLEQLKGIKSEDLFDKIADGLNQIDDRGRRAGLAMQLFGRSGTEMLPLLNANIAALKEQARILWITFTDEQAQQAADYTDALDILKKAIWGIVQQAVQNLLPVLTNLYKTLAVLIVRTRDWVVSIGQIAKGFVLAWAPAAAFFGNLDASLKSAFAAFKAFAYAVTEALGHAFHGITVGYAKMLNDMALGFEGLEEHFKGLPFVGDEARRALTAVSDGMSTVANSMVDISDTAISYVKDKLQDLVFTGIDAAAAIAGVNDEFFRTLGGVGGGELPGAPKLGGNEFEDQKKLLKQIETENKKTSEIMSGHWNKYRGGFVQGLGQMLAAGKSSFGELLKTMLSSLGPMAMQEGLYHVLAGQAMVASGTMAAPGKARISAGKRLMAWGAIASAIAGAVSGGGDDSGAGEGAGGGSTSSASDFSSGDDLTTSNERRAINIYNEGDIYDGRGYLQRLSELTEEFQDMDITLYNAAPAR